MKKKLSKATIRTHNNIKKLKIYLAKDEPGQHNNG
jgi:hypothetical protein